MTEEGLPPRFVAELQDGVGFLDAGDADAATLFDAVGAAWMRLPPGSVLTIHAVHTDAGRVIDQFCRERDLELVATIVHDGRGTTFTVR